MTTGVARPLDIFGIGLRHLRSRQHDKARAAFLQATTSEPTMCDAWLGRLATGEQTVEVAEGAYRARANLGSAMRSVQQRIADLDAHLTITVGTIALKMPLIGQDAELAIAYAVTLAEAEPPRLAEAAEVIERQRKRPNPSPTDADLLDYVHLGLLGLAQRWPDVLSFTNTQQWRSEPNFSQWLTDGMLAWKTLALLGTGSPAEALRYAEAGLKSEGKPTELHVKLRIARAYALRAQGDHDAAMQAFREVQAWIETPEAAAALADPAKKIEIVTAASLSTRENIWQPDSGHSAHELEAQEREATRDSVRAEAMELLERQIGMGGVKEQILRLESRIAMDQIRAEKGIGKKRDIALSYIFAGPPGTGKTTTARVMAKLFFGLGLIARPDVVEVKRAQLVDEYLGKTAQKTNAVIDKALGGLLFIDEAYALITKGYSDGDAYGQEAVDTLLARIENERSTDDLADKLAVVIAGYSDDIDRFLDSNDGLSSRFTTRIEFDSYTPRELIKIADLIAGAEDALYSAEAQDYLLAGLTQLAGKQVSAETYSGGTRHLAALDKAGNARFVRTVTEKAIEHRDFRLRNSASGLSNEELISLSASDVEGALREVCAAQRVPFD